MGNIRLEPKRHTSRNGKHPLSHCRLPDPVNIYHEVNRKWDFIVEVWDFTEKEKEKQAHIYREEKTCETRFRSCRTAWGDPFIKYKAPDNPTRISTRFNSSSVKFKTCNNRQFKMTVLSTWYQAIIHDREYPNTGKDYIIGEKNMGTIILIGLRPTRSRRLS